MFSIKKVSVLTQIFSSDTSTKYFPSNKLSTEKSMELFDQTALYGGIPPVAMNSAFPTPLLQVSVK